MDYSSLDKKMMKQMAMVNLIDNTAIKGSWAGHLIWSSMQFAIINARTAFR